MDKPLHDHIHLCSVNIFQPTYLCHKDTHFMMASGNHFLHCQKYLHHFLDQSPCTPILLATLPWPLEHLHWCYSHHDSLELSSRSPSLSTITNPQLITPNMGEMHLIHNGVLTKLPSAPSKLPCNSLGEHANTSTDYITKQPYNIHYDRCPHNIVLLLTTKYGGSTKVGNNICFSWPLKMILSMTLHMTQLTCGKG